jgi:AbrB family looped-hinge helix DNA binding protein
VTRQYVKTVSKKGQVVIPADIRRRMGIKRKVLFTEEKGKILIEPLLSMEEAFGTGGKVMYEVATEISKERRAEAKLEDA